MSKRDISTLKMDISTLKRECDRNIYIEVY